MMKSGNKRKEKEIQENPKWYVERTDKGKRLQKKRCGREYRYGRIGNKERRRCVCLCIAAVAVAVSLFLFLSYMIYPSTATQRHQENPLKRKL